MATSRDWCFTWNNPPDDWALGIARWWAQKPVQYIVWQTEEGESLHTVHIQGFVRFENSVRLSGALRWFRKTLKEYEGDFHPHFEPRRGSPEQAINYCKKVETRIHGPWEDGNSGVGRGKRTDLEEAFQLGISGCGLRSAINSTNAPGKLLKNERIFQRAAMLFPTPRELKRVVVFWGESGTGKTHDALQYFNVGLEGEIYPPYVVPAGSQWFPGYAGEKNVIFDEFYGAIKYSLMLQLLDPLTTTPKVEDKGVHYPFMGERIIITSNCHPRDWYDCDKGYKVPLLRRINRIVHYTRNPDGTVCKKEEANHAQEVPFHAETW